MCCGPTDRRTVPTAGSTIEDGFENQNCCRLRHPVADSGYAQRPLLLPVRLRNPGSTYRKRTVGSILQFLRQFVQPSLRTIDLDVLERLAVHSRRAAVDLAAVIHLVHSVHRSESSTIPSLLRATPSATAERFSGLLGSSPISLSFVASCVRLQPRPLPFPALPLFIGNTDLPATPKRPGLSLAGCRLIRCCDHRRGFPCCAWFPCLHAAANTPAGRMRLVRSCFPIRFGLPTSVGGSSPALYISRPAQRSLPLRPAPSPGRQSDPLHRRLRCLYRRFDCYRVERTSPRTGLAPAVDQGLFTAHNIGVLGRVHTNLRVSMMRAK